VPQAMQCPVRSEGGALEHPVGRVVGQRSPRSPQCPPHRLGPAQWDLACSSS
jgi:hypothetical protein